jgi:UDP:flavonoid glycosyltransferase YjiC (YdhE family)
MNHVPKFIQKLEKRKKILLVSRGSSGDVFPYLIVAAELQKRGHQITISIPSLFEKEAKAYGLKYVIQGMDDLEGMMRGGTTKSIGVSRLLSWINDTIDNQFAELMPLVQECDLFISTNTELAAPSIAECCKKPLIRTAYAPFIPGKKIPPPIFPFPKPNRFMAILLWKLLSISVNMISLKRLNKHRLEHGVFPLNNYAQHAPGYSHNQLMYSSILGTVDNDWKYSWNISGYCFNETFQYDETVHLELLRFIKKDERPTLFFSLGSCSSKKGKRFADMLLAIVKKNDYKLIIGSGWAKTGTHLIEDKHLFLMQNIIPHHLFFPECDAIIHHGGCGTTHSVARSGKPQMITPLFIDQHYWGYRVFTLGLGPNYINIGKISFKRLEKKVKDLVLNRDYQKNAIEIAEKISNENGINAFCDYVEGFLDKYKK